MKPSYIIIPAVGIIIAACLGDKSTQAGPSGPWKLLFNSRTIITSRAAFESALNNATDRWEKGVTIKERNHPLATRHDHANGPEPVLSSTEAYPSHNQPSNPDSLHVTQKVVLYQAKDYDAVLQTIQYHDSSSK
jgi:hypothetical protein